MLASVVSSFAFSGSSVVQKFTVWKKEHSKTYSSSAAESSALAAFATNDRIIEEHNAQDLSYTLGHNAYSDLTWEEFKWQMLPGFAPKKSGNNPVHVATSDESIADSVDWVAAGAVTKVKNQARCGSCWAFSTTGSVEGGLFVNEKKLVSLSEEDLVQCDKNGDQGCQGGLMDNAFEWIEKNGICTEDDYPYTSGSGTTGTCQKGCTPAVTLSGFKDIKARDEAGLKSAIAQQPVSVAIEADKSAFQLYKSGVLDSLSCGKSLDHGVLAVGYGTDGGKDYYKVKNSWGATWGENGYVRMVQGKNMCGIASQASYPTGVKSASALTEMVEAKAVNLAWSDCGAQHAKVTDVEPSQAILGEATKISGAGTLDADETGGTFSIEMKGDGLNLIKNCNGDAASPMSCKIAAVGVSVGTLEYGGVAFPFKAGDIKLDDIVTLTLGKLLPKAALKTTTTLKVTDSNGESLICVEIKSSPA